MSPAKIETLPCDILIVGAGIAGAALACGLRGRGYRVVQVELSDRPLDTARGENSVNAQKQLFAKIASVDAVDPVTVKVTLSGPQGDFLYNLGWGDAIIVTEANAANNGTAPIGTGPYTLGEWVKGEDPR